MRRHPASAWSSRTPPRSPSPRMPRARRSSCGSSPGATRRTSGGPARPISPAPRRPCARSWPSSMSSTARRTTSSSTRRRCASGSTRPTTGTGRSTLGSARSRGWSSAPACRSTRSARRKPWPTCVRPRAWRPRNARSGRPPPGRPAPAAVSADGGPRSSVTSGPPKPSHLVGPGPLRPASCGDPPRVAGQATVSSQPGSAGVLALGGWACMTRDRATARALLEQLFRAHGAEIHAYLVRMLRDPDLAADLTQETFVKAFRACDTLEDASRARAWLYQIAGRTALDELRHRRVVRFVPWSGQSRGLAASAEELALRDRLSAELERALARLPDRQRQALLLAELHGFSGLELAAALGVRGLG